MLSDFSTPGYQAKPFALDLKRPVSITMDELGVKQNYPPFCNADETTNTLKNLTQKYLDPIGVEFGFRAVRQSVHYFEEAQLCGISRQQAFNNIFLQKILPKIIIDTNRLSADGKDRLVLLNEMHDEISRLLNGFWPDDGTDSCIDELERIIRGAESNNGIANYWLR
jgi:hypothetical protein